MKCLDSTKNIVFDPEDSRITNLFIQSYLSYEFEDLPTSFFIKFSLKGTYTDLLFVIDSIDPLRCFGGGIIYETLIWSIQNVEEKDLINLILSWNGDKLVEIASNAIMIGLDNKLELYKSPTDQKYNEERFGYIENDGRKQMIFIPE